MKKVIFSSLLLVGFISLAGCLKNEEYVDHCLDNQQTIQKSSLYDNSFTTLQVGDYNAYYKAYRSNPSQISPLEGNQVYIKFVGKLLNGTIFDKTYKDSVYIFPMNPLANSSVIIGLNEVVRNMHKGDSAIALLPSCMAFNASQAYGGQIPAYSPIIFDNLVLTNVLSEDERIDDYIKTKKYKTDSVSKSSTGLRIVSKTPGSGDFPKTGQTVTVSYKGYLINGDVYFDPVKTSANPNPPASTYSFVVDNPNTVIDGWHEAVKTIRTGGTAIWIMPSSLAYKDRGVAGSSVSIPGYSPLAFEVKLISIQ